MARKIPLKTQPDGAPAPWSVPRRRALARRLESWFAQFQRDLPWRDHSGSDAERGYIALVSESMLQQTQVARVIEYFERFMTRFPTVNVLAEAEEQEVLALWQGLGYYRRARNLQAAARMIVDEFDGVVPREVDLLLRLPGIGRYTAGAIASIAFGERAAIVDGNVARVLARLLLIDEPIESPHTQRTLWTRAQELVAQSKNPGQFNQALMELGSTVCLPRGAKCDECPVSTYCAAKAGHCVDRVPHPKVRPEQKKIHAATVVITRRGRLFLTQRPDHGLWSAMWQAPTLEDKKRITSKELQHHLAEQFGLQMNGLKKIGSFTHQTSHREITFSVYEPKGGVTGRVRGGRWVEPNEMNEFPLSNAQKRALKDAGQG